MNNNTLEEIYKSKSGRIRYPYPTSTFEDSPIRVNKLTFEQMLDRALLKEKMSTSATPKTLKEMHSTMASVAVNSHSKPRIVKREVDDASFD